MKESLEENFVDYGCGFPVVIDEVRIRKDRNGEIPLIDYDLFQRKVLEALVTKSGPLTGNQIRFIRLYHRLTLQAFASLLKVSHPAVLKWEKQGDEPTSMAAATEILLRLFVCEKLGTRASDFVRRFRWLMDNPCVDSSANTSHPLRVIGVSPAKIEQNPQRGVG